MGKSERILERQWQGIASQTDIIALCMDSRPDDQEFTRDCHNLLIAIHILTSTEHGNLALDRIAACLINRHIVKSGIQLRIVPVNMVVAEQVLSPTYRQMIYDEMYDD